MSRGAKIITGGVAGILVGIGLCGFGGHEDAGLGGIVVVLSALVTLLGFIVAAVDGDK